MLLSFAIIALLPSEQGLGWRRPTGLPGNSTTSRGRAVTYAAGVEGHQLSVYGQKWGNIRRQESGPESNMGEGHRLPLVCDYAEK